MIRRSAGPGLALLGLVAALLTAGVASGGAAAATDVCDSGPFSKPPPREVTAAPDFASSSTTYSWLPPESDCPVTGYRTTFVPVGPSQTPVVTNLPAEPLSWTRTGMGRGDLVQVSVQALYSDGSVGAVANGGSGVFPATPLGAGGKVVTQPGGAKITWSRADYNPQYPTTEYRVEVDGSLVRSVPADGRDVNTPYSMELTGYAPGSQHVLAIRAVNQWGASDAHGVPFTVPTVPKAVRVDAFTVGKPGGKLTIEASWPYPPDGGMPAFSYRVKAYLVTKSGRLTHKVKAFAQPRALYVDMTFNRPGPWVFQVQSKNAVGWSRWGKRSKAVLAR